MKTRFMPDIYMLLIYVALLICGALAIYSAQITHGSARDLLSSHSFVIIIMSILTFIVLLIPDFFDSLDKLVPMLLFITLILLVAVIFVGISVVGSEAKRWLLITNGFTLQPSEIAKVTSLIYFASVLSKKGEKLLDIKRGLFPPLAVLLIISMLIMFEPDTGTAMLFSIVGFTMFFYAGIPFRSLLLSGLLILVIFIVFIFNVPYMKNRVTAYLEPNSIDDSSYQIRRARLAYANGGLTGLSDEELQEASTHLPAATTDFIYASISQHYGFVGNIIVVLLFLFFTLRGFIISFRMDSLFLKYVSFGITMFISIQAYLNIMVAVLIIPTTGIPLPFISYGRNALVINMLMMAIMLKITQRE